MAQTYAPELIAVVVCPLVAYRLVQSIKNHTKRGGSRPSAIVMHLIGFNTCALLAIYALQGKYGVADATFGALIISACAGGIVEFIFRATRKRAPAVHAALSGEIYTDDRTVFKTVLGAAVGAQVKPDRRDEATRQNGDVAGMQ